jgi:hypothetical protein
MNKCEQYEISHNTENPNHPECHTVSLCKCCLHLHGLSSTKSNGSLNLKDECARLLQNNGNHLPNNTASQSTRSESSSMNEMQLKLKNFVLLRIFLKQTKFIKHDFVLKQFIFRLYASCN